mmetsp:Transcript_40187/g.44871  ORF Transcript_40187/g.44871 Transcript_40187/m.44871 type:complete len:271 (+) Transcript_40187:203-1015(+)
MNSSATTPPTTKNERWSTNVNDSCLAYKKSNNSDRLRKILDFGGGKHTRTRTRSQSLALQEEEEEEERKEPASHPAIRYPSRRSSIDSSISSLGDSISSFGTATAGPIFKPATTKNKNTSRSKQNKNTLLQYSTSDSLSSFGSIHKNDRWRSSSKSSNSNNNNNNNNDRWKSSTASSKVSVRYPTHQKSNDNMLSLAPTTTSTTANHSLTNGVNHQRRRWSAAHAIGNGNGNKTENGTTTSRGGGGDQPIGMVARKLSSTYLITIANNLI